MYLTRIINKRNEEKYHLTSIKTENDSITGRISHLRLNIKFTIIKKLIYDHSLNWFIEISQEKEFLI